MANWYISTVAYAAVQTWTALTGGLATAVSTGVIVRQTTPTAGNERCFRCTTAGNTGTTEPTWNLNQNATTTDGTVTWTECSGQESHQHDNGITTSWACPYNRLVTAQGNGSFAGGDTCYLSSDHNETQASNMTLGGGNATKCISVNKAGSVPPVAADVTPGAQVSTSGTGQLTVGQNCNAYYEGIYFTAGSGGSSAGFFIDQSGNQHYIHLKNCKVTIGTTVSDVIKTNQNGGACTVVFENTPVVFGNSSCSIQARGGTFIWKNTPNALSGTALTANLFFIPNSLSTIVDVSGCDLSFIGSCPLVNVNSGTNVMCTYSFRNCKLGTNFGNFTNGPMSLEGERLEIVNCDSGNTNYHHEWYTSLGSVKTDATNVRVNGATDGTTAASRKMVSLASTTGTARPVITLDHRIFFWFSGTTGISHTATVEIISSTSLFNDEIWGEVEYPSDGSSPRSSLADNTIATVLSAHAAQPSSSATWNNPPSTPQTQKLVVTFTPQKIGLCIFKVKLAKISTTVWIDPIVTVV